MNLLFYTFAVFFIVKILNRLAPYCHILFKKMFYWLHALVFEMIAVVLTLVLRIAYCFVPQWFHPNVRHNERHGQRPNSQQRNFVTKACNDTPILLIHGYLHNSSGWIFFYKALAYLGFRSIYTLDLRYPFRSIVDYAAIVAKKSEEICKESGKKELILIGHSMGGLVASWYATHLASPNTDLRVITLGAPLRGTYAAFVALGQNGKEMRPRSSFTQELRESLRKIEVPLYHIGSLTDQIVLPGSSAFTGLPRTQECRIENLGHMSLLFSPRVIKQVAAWLM